MLKEIDTTLPLPKYYQISESIKEMISRGEFVVGDKIPTYRMLTKYFKTTMPTICNAVRQLESDGYISKVQGKGMFVMNQESESGTSEAIERIRKVGIIIPHSGDLYQNIINGLTGELAKYDIYATHLPTTFLDDDVNLEQKEISLKKVIASGFDSLIIDGHRHLPFKLLHKYRSHFRQIDFIAHYASEIDFPDANVIIFDAFKSGCIAAEYLIKSGKKKFLFITYDKFSEVERKRNGCVVQTHDLQALEGMKSVLSKAGFDETCLTVLHQARHTDQTSPTPELIEILKKNKLGIFAFGDSRSVAVYKAAKWNNIDMHENLSIVGLYDISWAEILHPMLTSISINETEIARLAADCIVNRKTGQQIVVEPKLVIRET